MCRRERMWREFDAIAKRSIRWRIDYGFVYTDKPVLDECQPCVNRNPFRMRTGKTLLSDESHRASAGIEIRQTGS